MLVSKVRAISASPCPLARNRMISALKQSRRGIVVARARRSNSARSSGVNSRTEIGRPMACYEPTPSLFKLFQRHDTSSWLRALPPNSFNGRSSKRF
jgi:hypothetical protein